MVPVAVSVPASAAVNIKMVFDNWAFGEMVGVPREG